MGLNVVASTYLEFLFWNAVYVGRWEQYLAELMITDLEGPGDEPDDFPGSRDEK
jgi:hypothetical protein